MFILGGGKMGRGELKDKYISQVAITLSIQVKKMVLDLQGKVKRGKDRETEREREKEGYIYIYIYI